MTKGRELIERLVIVRPQSAPCKPWNICDENRPSISSVMTIRFILGRGNRGKKRGKFVGSMAASINGRWLLQHCQIETIENSSSDGRTELRLASVLAHTDTKKRMLFIICWCECHFILRTKEGSWRISRNEAVGLKRRWLALSRSIVTSPSLVINFIVIDL